MKHCYDLVNSFLKMKSVSHFSNLLKHDLQFTSTSGLITLLKLKEGNSASSKRPLSKDNRSWTAKYFNYCHCHVSFFFQECPQVSNNTMESPGYPSYYTHTMGCNISLPIPLGTNMRVFFQVFYIADYGWSCW